MVNLLAGYYINAVVRERVRAWMLAGKLESQSQEKGVQRGHRTAELDIEIFGQRASDMKAVLARYPDAARMDSRQVVSVNPAEGGERYLSPLAQLVGAESAISERREMIRRWQRDLKQKNLLKMYYADAEGMVDRQVEVAIDCLLNSQLAKKTFSHADAAQEWNQEAALRVNGALDNFEVMRSQFGVRNGVRAGAVSGRNPVRLATLGFAAGLLLLGILAFVRGSVFGARSDGETAQEISEHA